MVPLEKILPTGTTVPDPPVEVVSSYSVTFFVIVNQSRIGGRISDKRTVELVAVYIDNQGVELVCRQIHGRVVEVSAGRLAGTACNRVDGRVVRCLVIEGPVPSPRPLPESMTMVFVSVPDSP